MLGADQISDFADHADLEQISSKRVCHPRQWCSWSITFVQIQTQNAGDTPAQSTKFIHLKCAQYVRKGHNLGKFNYGGQAVIEGVMMRGSQGMAVAVRQPNGEILVHTEPLDPRIYTGPVSRWPFLRALPMLWDTLVLGMRTLMFSADVALVEEEEEVEFKGPVAWATMLVSLAVAAAIFFVTPLLLVGLVDRYIASSILSNLVEGIIRLLLVVGYIWAIGFMRDIRRVFAYHGAEHKTINAYEAGAPLEPEAIKSFTTLHPRCGTGFLLIVVLISVLIFSLLGRPPMLLRILSRIVLIPVVAGLGYEAMKFGAAHRHNRLVRWSLAPGLALQRLTTREPTLDMLEVAIAALHRVLVEEGLASEADKSADQAGIAQAAEVVAGSPRS